MPKVCVGEPANFEDEIDDFVAFVLAGGEVTAKGLRDRVTNASFIALARENKCLLGVAGLKSPAPSYRSRVEKSSGVTLAAESFPFELGWVFVLPSARGRGLSTALCRPLVALAETRGVFATSRTDNPAMHRTLEKVGFERAGKKWASRENEATLMLFVKTSAQAGK